MIKNNSLISDSQSRSILDLVNRYLLAKIQSTTYFLLKYSSFAYILSISYYKRLLTSHFPSHKT